MKRPLPCLLLGHSFNKQAAAFYSLWHCDRCDREMLEGDVGIRGRVSVWLWLVWDCVRNRIEGWRYWLRCDECGRWFGKHDTEHHDLWF